MSGRSGAKWVGVSVAGVLVAGVLLALANGGAIVNLYQISEWDGGRQLEYKILGFIPYEKQELSPETQVSADYWHEMDKSGIKIGPEIDRKNSQGLIARIVRPHETEYWLRQSVKGDHAALVAKYSSQLSSPSPYSTTWTYHTPTMTSKGKSAIKLLIDLRSKGTKPKDQVSDFGIGITVPRENALK